MRKQENRRHEGIALHFLDYIEYFTKSKLYLFPKNGENCPR